MEETVFPSQVENKIPESQFVEIMQPGKKISNASIVFLLCFLAVLAAGSFATGWGISRLKHSLSSSNKTTSEKTGTVKEKGDSAIYSDKESAYSITFPKAWKHSIHNEAEGSGIKISNEETSVELWLRFDKVVELSSEQKAALKSTKTETAQIAGQTASITTNEYTAGNFFIVAAIAATETTPQVTFWVSAKESSGKDEALKVVESFKFI